MNSEQRNQALADGMTEAIEDLLVGRIPEKLDCSGGADEATKKACESLNRLIGTFAEAGAFLAALSEGRLDVEAPPRNHLVSPFKQLHANLRHLAWQTHQITQGDLNQRVDFLGEFSTSFNSLIDSLREKRAAEEALRESREKLKAANRELDAFAYSVSHDLRTPLRSVAGFARLLTEDYADKLDEEGRDSLRRIEAGAKRMGDIVEALLNLSRLTRREISCCPVDLSAMVNDEAGELMKSGPERPVELVVAGDVTVTGDAALLRVLVDNLIGNAWKFTAGKKPARIEFGTLRINGGTAYFVKDNGAGFDAAYEKKLFKLFERLHSTSQFPGIGIGLVTALRIVQRHGGRIWAEGEVGKGATFYFTLTPECMQQ